MSVHMADSMAKLAGVRSIPDVGDYIESLVLSVDQSAATTLQPFNITRRIVPMPTYEYCCDSCGKKFSVTLNMAEHEEGHLACPDCKSEHIVQQYSAFYAKTSKKS